VSEKKEINTKEMLPMELFFYIRIEEGVKKRKEKTRGLLCHDSGGNASSYFSGGRGQENLLLSLVACYGDT